jgi:hypothetical protein
VPESRPAQIRPNREREGHDFSRATNPRKVVIPSEVKGLCVFTDHSDPHEKLSLLNCHSELNVVIPSKIKRRHSEQSEESAVSGPCQNPGLRKTDQTVKGKGTASAVPPSPVKLSFRPKSRDFVFALMTATRMKRCDY